MRQPEFNLVRRGGYDPKEVAQYIQSLESELNRTKRELEVQLNKSSSNEPQLYDPEGAIVKALAAAQTVADRIIGEAEVIAREKIAEYHRQNREAIEKQARIYANEKSNLTSKLSDIRAMQGELKREVKELVEQSKFKMTVIAQVAKELEGLSDSTEILVSMNNHEAVRNERSKQPARDKNPATLQARIQEVQKVIENEYVDGYPETFPAEENLVTENYTMPQRRKPELVEESEHPTEFFDPLLTADNHLF